MEDSYDIVFSLLASKANINMKDCNQKTAYEISQEVEDKIKKLFDQLVEDGFFWNTTLHPRFPLSFHNQVFTLLLARKTGSISFPKPVLMIIIQYLSN